MKHARRAAFVAAVLAVRCGTTAPPDHATAHPDSAFAAATGVARAEGAGDRARWRVVPLRPLAGDAEVVSGDPEKPGEPFVMRIKELPGGIVPPHTHP
ncbi:MAG TPA: hypothetical protein VG777_08845, partial [Thermoanaerobaculia bacterium]|nr:hypothetical protein [Thermoanaerobaculia bacterium]